MTIDEATTSDTAQKRPHGRQLARKAGFAITALIALIITSFWLYVQSAGGLAAVFEKQLTSPEVGIKTSIDDASLSFFNDGFNAEITLNTITISLGEQQLSIPEMVIDISPLLWLNGGLWQVELSQLSLDLTQDEAGFSLSGDWAVLNDYLAAPSRGAGANPALFAALANRRLAITDSQISLRRADDDKTVSLNDLAVDIDVNSSDMVTIKANANLNDDPASRLAIAASYHLRSMLTDATISSTGLAADDLAPFLPASAKPLGALGMIDGEIQLLADGLMIETLTADLNAKDGQLMDARAFKDLSLSARYSRNDDYLALPRLDLTLLDGQKLSFAGDIAALSSPELGFEGMLTLRDIPIDSILSAWPPNALPDVHGYLLSSFSGGDFSSLSVDFKGGFDKAQSTLSLSRLSLDGTVNQVALSASYGQYQDIRGTADARLSFEVMGGGQLRQAFLDMTIQDGVIVTDDDMPPIAFHKATANLLFQPGAFIADEFAIDFKQDGNITGTANFTLDDDRTLTASQINLSSDSLSLAAFNALLPTNISPRTSAFLADRITNGWLDNIAVSLQTAKPEGDDKPQIIDQLKVSAEMRDVSFNYLEDQPPVTALSGLVTITDNRLDIVIDSGKSLAFDVTSAKAQLTPLIVTDNTARALAISPQVTGRLEHMLALLASPEINLLDDLPVNLNNASGDITAKIGLKANITNDAPLSLNFTTLDATISSGAAPSFIQEYNLTNSDLVLGYRDKKWDITGTATLDDITSHFTLSSQADEISISGNIIPSSHISDYLTDITSQEITGEIGGKFVVSSLDGGKSITSLISADLTNAGIHIPMINWAKLPNEEASVTGTIHFDDGKLRRIDRLQMTAPDLSATGHLEMTQTGAFSAAYLQDLSWPGNQVNEVIIERNGASQLTIIADGPQLDLRPLRSGQNAQSSIALSFDVTSDNLVIDDSISLLGRMTGEITQNGDGQAQLQGALLHEGEALISQGTITAFFGAGGEYLNAVGLIGGAEARLEYSPDDAGGHILIVKSQNAGRVLSGLGITDTIRSGRLVLVNRFPTSEFDRFDTTINLEEFNVIEAPAAVRAFSVLGLAGLYTLVEGDGTHFTRGQATISTTGDRHDIIDLKASGGAVGLTMVGSYNSATRQVDVSGNLVPVNQFSKIVGAVPLLGDLLAGVDNAGIFTTQFNVTGSIDDPETSVNAASLVPGVLRDLFSPEWLGREAKRIFGSDNETEN